MIAADQVSIFPPDYRVATSSLAEGTIRNPSLDADASANITAWCAALAVPFEQTVGLAITYSEERTYTDVVTVDGALDGNGAATARGWIKGDAIITTTPGLALILPVADCNAVVYVDPVHHVVALLHLGWHATIRNLASKVLDHMVEQYGSRPEDILIYNSPSIHASSYRFTHLSPVGDPNWRQEPYAVLRSDGTYAIDLVQYNYDQWMRRGIQPDNIEIADVDTAASDDYPSHFAGQKGRFAVLAMLLP